MEYRRPEWGRGAGGENAAPEIIFFNNLGFSNKY